MDEDRITKRDEIRNLNEHLRSAIIDESNLQNQFMALYIQQTGSFPA